MLKLEIVFSIEYSNNKPSAQDIVNYMETLGCHKFDNKIQQKNTLSLDISLPSVGVERGKVVTTTINAYVNMNDGYQHVMQCIYGINDTLLDLVSSITSIVYTWN